jgi:hypothetical protein
VWCGAAHACRFSAGCFDHLRHGCSGCCLRDVACADLGRPKKKGRRDARVYGALNRLAGCGGEPVVRSYRRQGKEHRITSRDACRQASPHQNMVGATNGSAPRQGAGPGTGWNPPAPQPQSYNHPREVRIKPLGRSSAIGAAWCFQSHTRGKRRPQKIRDACRQASLQIGTSLTAAPQELRTTGWLKQWRPTCKSMTLRRKRVSDLVAMLVEGGRKVGSGLL